MRLSDKFRPFLISLIATPLLLLVGLISGGSGHGDYILATLLFPIANTIRVAAILLFVCPEYGDCFPRDAVLMLSAVLQYPAYGLLFSLIERKGLFAIILAAIHICFFIDFWLYFGKLGFD
jgi:hypothetical protein